MRARYTFTIDTEHEDYQSLDELLKELEEVRKDHEDIFCLRTLMYSAELPIDVELTTVEDLDD